MRARRRSGGDSQGDGDHDVPDGCAPRGDRGVTPQGSWTTPCLSSRLPSAPVPHAVDALAVTQDGKTVFVAGAAGGTAVGVCCVDASAPGRLSLVASAGAPPAGAGGLGITVLALNPTGGGFYTGSRDGELSLWTAACVRVSSVSAHRDGVTCLVGTPGIDVVWTAGEDGALRSWTTGQREAHLAGAGGDDDDEAGAAPDYQRWPVTLRRIRSIRASTRRRITCLVLGPAGTPSHDLVVSGAVDCTVRMFARSTGEAVVTCRGHGRYITRIAFSPDGRHVLSGSLDGTVRMWTAPGGVAVTTFATDLPHPPGAEPTVDGLVACLTTLPRHPGHGGDDSDPLAASPTAFVSATVGGTLCVWDATRNVQLGCHPTSDPVHALTVLPPRLAAGTPAAPLTWHADVVTSHRSGALRTWRVRLPAPPAGGGDAMDVDDQENGGEQVRLLGTLPAVHNDWATHVTPLPCHGGNVLVLSAGEDGVLATVKVAAPTQPWSRATHSAFPGAFQAAARAFLLCLARIAARGIPAEQVQTQARVPELLLVVVPAEREREVEDEANKKMRTATGATPKRLHAGVVATAVAGAPCGTPTPVSPPPGMDVDLPAPRSTGRRGVPAAVNPTAGATATAASQMKAAAQARRGLGPSPASRARTSLGTALHVGLPLHGVTRDAVVDRVLAALAADLYSPGRA